MNIILIIILLNIVLIITFKYSIYLSLFLLIFMSIFMIKVYYNINNVLEGFENKNLYKYDFYKLLNKEIKTDLNENLLFNNILGNFTELIKLIDIRDEKVPDNQMCKGEFSDWMGCSKECGRGKKIRKFNELQKAGKTGINCLYENGQIESKECVEKMCDDGGNCEDNIDCLSGYCDETTNTCTYPNECSISQTENCNFQQCQSLNNNFGEYSYNLEKNMCENIKKDSFLKKKPIGLGQERDIFKVISDIYAITKTGFGANFIAGNVGNLCKELDVTKYVKNCSLTSQKNCVGSWESKNPMPPSGLAGPFKIYPCYNKDNKCARAPACSASGSSKNRGPKNSKFEYCQQDLNGSGTSCTEITGQKSLNLYNFSYRNIKDVPVVYDFGCLIDRANGACNASATWSPCPRGHYSSNGRKPGCQVCQTTAPPGSARTEGDSGCTNTKNTDFTCESGFFWPGTGKPPQDSNGSYLSGCMPCESTINCTHGGGAYGNCNGSSTNSRGSGTCPFYSTSPGTTSFGYYCSNLVENDSFQIKENIDGVYPGQKKGRQGWPTVLDKKGFKSPYSDYYKSEKYSDVNNRWNASGVPRCNSPCRKNVNTISSGWKTCDDAIFSTPGVAQKICTKLFGVGDNRHGYGRNCSGNKYKCVYKNGGNGCTCNGGSCGAEITCSASDYNSPACTSGLINRAPIK